MIQVPTPLGLNKYLYTEVTLERAKEILDSLVGMPIGPPQYLDILQSRLAMDIHDVEIFGLKRDFEYVHYYGF